MEATMDLTKLKVADLKKELKLRGLSTAGKRTELLERLQEGVAAGVGLAEDDGEEEYDEDEILAGDDADDDDSKMTPSEEAAALAAAEKATATPMRGRRAAAAATPRTANKKLALRRTTSPSLVVPAEPEPVTPAPVTPKAAVTPVSKKTPIKTPVAASAENGGTEPAKKVIKLSGGKSAVTVPADSSDKENGTEPAVEKTAAELRAERFGIVSEPLQKQKRAERFGATNKKGNKLSMDVGSIDVEKLKARANRFGETIAKTLTQAEVDEKKKARNERFGIDAASDGPKKDVTSDEVLAARAAKFSTGAAAAATMAITEPIISASGKKLITVAGSADEVSKLKRAARFGA